MGEDRESKHKRHKKHSSSKKRSHKHKSEHKHRSSRHHRHDRSHKKKHHKHKEKKEVDEAVLQNAIESLEVLEDILKASGEFSPEELMSQVLKEANADADTGEDTEDSSSDSEDDREKKGEEKGEEPGSQTVAEVAAVKEQSEDNELGKGSSMISPSAVVEPKPTKSQDSVKETDPSPVLTESKKESEPVSAENQEISHKSENESPSAVHVDSAESKPSSSQPAQTEHESSDSESSSEAETEKKKKTSASSSSKDGVFKPFSKKLKALGSRTAIKINIRPKEGSVSTAGTDDAEGESAEGKATVADKADSTKVESKSKSTRESKREYESKRHKRSTRRSRSRSRSRYRRGRSSRSRSRSPRRRRSRSRSRSRSRRSRRGRSSSRSRYRSRSRSHSHSNSRPSVKQKKKASSNKKGKDAASKKTENEDMEKGASAPVGKGGVKKKEISQLTAFCKDLQEKQAHEDVYGEITEEQETTQIHHPFAVQPAPTSTFQQPSLIYHNNAWKTTNQLAIEASASQAVMPLVEKFPVSAGLHHTREDNDITVSDNVFAKYQEVSKLSMTDLVSQRVQAQRQILINPANIEAHRALNYVEQQTSLWAESKVTPGQYTGQLKLTPLSKEAHNTGLQAWAKKNMFRGLAPVGDGFGMKMLKKMGWREGQPIGKQGEGHVEPICPDIKVDRSGLATESDWRQRSGGVQPASVLKATKSDAKTASLVQGKHPVSALQELCARKRWDPPRYELKHDNGPAHMKMFLYQVSTQLGTFQPAVGSSNKKIAKMQAATAALQALGLVEKTIEYTSS